MTISKLLSCLPLIIRMAKPNLRLFGKMFSDESANFMMRSAVIFQSTVSIHQHDIAGERFGPMIFDMDVGGIRGVRFERSDEPKQQVSRCKNYPGHVWRCA